MITNERRPTWAANEAGRPGSNHTATRADRAVYSVDQQLHAVARFCPQLVELLDASDRRRAEAGR